MSPSPHIVRIIAGTPSTVAAEIATGDFLTTELSEPLTTEAGDNLVWES